eukprot:9490720-Pyramimonas_sp.AAC.3
MDNGDRQPAFTHQADYTTGVFLNWHVQSHTRPSTVNGHRTSINGKGHPGKNKPRVWRGRKGISLKNKFVEVELEPGKFHLIVYCRSSCPWTETQLRICKGFSPSSGDSARLI